jgi:gamma-glutamyltranspeptidase/glutathione hydrolase
LNFPAVGDALSIDFHARAGERCNESQWEPLFESAAEDGFGYLVRGRLNDVGYQAIAVPGMLAGLSEIHSRFGSKPWAGLVLRAVRYAENGFLVGPGLADYWSRPGHFGRASTRERITYSEASRAQWLKPDGTMFATGDVVRQPDLAETYRRLAAEGAESFYRGNLARRIAADLGRNGALVTAGDLARYRPTVAAPVAGSYRGLRVVSTPLPGGGVALLQALSLLESVQIGSLSHNGSRYVDVVARALHAVSRDRLALHGDPEFGAPSPTELLSPDHLAGLRGGRTPAAEADSPCTTQIVIVDRAGNAVCFSHSLGFGSGVVTPGLGFSFNNCMSAFDPRPGRHNSIAPGKARTTAVAQSLVFDRGDLRIVLGSPGAARITAALVQVILDVVDFDMSVAEAVVHPRFDAFGENHIELESRFSLDVVDELSAMGWDARRVARPFGHVGRVYGVEIDRGNASGIRVHAGVDPGEPGAAYRV